MARANDPRMVSIDLRERVLPAIRFAASLPPSSSSLPALGSRLVVSLWERWSDAHGGVSDSDSRDDIAGDGRWFSATSPDNGDALAERLADPVGERLNCATCHPYSTDNHQHALTHLGDMLVHPTRHLS